MASYKAWQAEKCATTTATFKAAIAHIMIPE